jgi:hypothetical protein
LAAILASRGEQSLDLFRIRRRPAWLAVGEKCFTAAGCLKVGNVVIAEKIEKRAVGE